MKNESHQVVCYGEILWDILPSGELPGGAPMNVAFHLQKMGMHPALISKIGNDAHGQRLVDILTAQGVETGFIQTDANHPTGIVNATIGQHNEVTYEIVQPVAWDFIENEERQIPLVEAARFFVFGSLVTRQPTSRKTLMKLLENARTKVLDINLRPPHFNQPMVETLLQHADILKLNHHELELIAGWYGATGGEEEKVTAIQNRFNIKTIIVTKGGDGALLNINGSFYYHPGYRVQVVDTVGSGDAFLAGFLYKTANGASAEETVQFANAMGALMASYNGACPQYQLSEAEALIQGTLQVR